MDEDTRELVNRLFVTATAMLEDASLIAAAGQSVTPSPSALADHARRLQSAARTIAAIAEAAAIIAETNADSPRGLPRPNR